MLPEFQALGAEQGQSQSDDSSPDALSPPKV